MNSHSKFLVDSYHSSKIITDPRNRRALQELFSQPMFQELKRRVAATGALAPDPAMYVVRLAVVHAALIASFLWLMPSPLWSVRVAGMVLTAFAIVQGIFVAHEADHGAMTKDRRIVDLIGLYTCTVLSGYCFSYFRRTHALHHYHCQEELYDPDAQFGMFSMSERDAVSRTGLMRLLTRYQAVLIPALIPLWSFDMKVESMAYVARNFRRAKADIIGLILHFLLWFVVCGLWVGIERAVVYYVGWVMFAGLYLGAIIPVNHLGTTLLSPGQTMTFVEQQVVTSRNIAGPRILDFLFIGLNRQIEHHIFPWAPSTRLHRGREVVRTFCEEQGIQYREVGYWTALRDVWGHFHRMAMLARRPYSAVLNMKGPRGRVTDATS